MGTCFSTNDKVVPSELNELERSFDRSNSKGSFELKSKTRSTTDICFLLFFAIFLTVLLCFLGYCVFNGDIYRIINGYDDCGNVCGKPPIHSRTRNSIISDKCLSAGDKNLGPYHIMFKPEGSNLIQKMCVASCKEFPGYREFFNHCVPNKNKTTISNLLSKAGLKNFFSNVSEDFQLCWREFCYLCLISFGFSVLILLLFRYLVGFVVWIVLVGVVVACTTGTIVLWLLWRNSEQEMSTIPEFLIQDIDSRKSGTYLAFAIVATIVTVIVILIIFVMRKRIQLVVQLFEEAGKAISDMPILLGEPVLTFVCLVIVVSLWFYLSLWIESSGFLTEKRPNVYFYEKNGWIKFTRWYNFFAMLWVAQFVIGCQHMVIAGAVAAWYFTRTKNDFNCPVFKSAYNLSRYHLGSVAMGSFLIAVIQFIRVVFKAIEKYLNKRQGNACIDCLLKCCNCCLYCFEKFLKYLSRNAYIEVAIYGYPFCKAGQQAFKLLSSNVLRVTVINSVGDFVLFLGKVLVVIATVLIGVEMLQDKEGIQYIWVPLTLAGLFAYLISHCFMTVYEMTIDTIFLCFCEDCEQNDGISRPYYMSRGLMEFVENSKKALRIEDKKVTTKAWQDQSVPTISSSLDREEK